jgi:outer membrane protein assembly factor BamD
MARTVRSLVRTCARVALLVALPAASAGLGAGCASSDDGKSVTYSSSAKQNYEKGLAELADESYPEAVKYFDFVKSKFPFSKYAVLSELALADTAFSRGNYQEAIDAYKNFARLHPTHEKVEDGYVAFKVAESYVKDMPDDFFLLPPTAERDQSLVRDAMRELSDFVDKFPDSKYLKQVVDYRRQVLRRLIEHEMYVATFYLDRDKPKAAILRIETALKRYPDSGRDAELLLLLGQTQLKMGDAGRARDSFARVVREYGKTGEARRAQLYLDFIQRQYGDNPGDKQADQPAPATNAPAGGTGAAATHG